MTTRAAMTAHDGGPAFPCAFENHTGGSRLVGGILVEPGARVDALGMSLRDHFATAAMQAAATNPTGANGFTFEQRAAWAYQQADAMLTERAK